MGICQSCRKLETMKEKIEPSRDEDSIDKKNMNPFHKEKVHDTQKPSKNNNQYLNLHCIGRAASARNATFSDAHGQRGGPQCGAHRGTKQSATREQNFARTHPTVLCACRIRQIHNVAAIVVHSNGQHTVSRGQSHGLG